MVTFRTNFKYSVLLVIKNMFVCVLFFVVVFFVICGIFCLFGVLWGCFFYNGHINTIIYFITTFRTVCIFSSFLSTTFNN